MYMCIQFLKLFIFVGSWTMTELYFYGESVYKEPEGVRRCE